MLYLSSSRVLQAVLIIMLSIVPILGVSAVVPTISPTPSIPVGGMFSQYFSNMAVGCIGSNVVAGFDMSPTSTYLTPQCLDVNSIIGSYMVANPISSSQWISGLFGSISYPGGGVGIGTLAGGTVGAKLEVAGDLLISGSRPITLSPAGSIFIQANAGGWSDFLHFGGSAGTDRGGFGAYGLNDSLNYLYAGDSYLSPTMVWKGGDVGVGTIAPAAKLEVVGNIIANTPILINHVTTKGYVDGRLLSLCTSIGGTWNNTTALCTPATIYTWQTGAYGACSASCGPGSQVAPTVCKRGDGVIVADSNCTGTKPSASSISCNLGPCPLPPPPPPVCTNSCTINVDWSNCYDVDGGGNNIGLPFNITTIQFSLGIITPAYFSSMSGRPGPVTCYGGSLSPSSSACLATGCNTVCGTSISWTVGTKTCTGVIQANTTHGTNTSATDSSGNSAVFACNNGALTELPAWSSCL